MKTIAELVDHLFKTIKKPTGREYTYVEVAETLQGAIDPSHISKLRAGHIKNPSRETLLALCRFFKQPSSYFFPELEEPAESVDEEDVLDLVNRGRFSPAVKQKLMELIRALNDDTEEEEEKEGEKDDTPTN
jgi:transcriptional regulator with XRE-family HTH domain